MKVKPLILGALALLASGERITAQTLNHCAQAVIVGRSLREQPSLTVEEARLTQEADRIIQRLTEIDVAQLEDDAIGRFGELLAACRGLTMKPVGPVAHAFRTDKSAVSTIMGPYGSAKTTTCFQKIINSVIWQPEGADGIKRARWCVVRDTYGHLQANVMADWFLWFPKTKDNYNLSTNTHVVTFDIPMAAGKVMHLRLEMLFRAVESQSAEELFKGMALTGLWLNEMDTLHKDVFRYGFPRVGRYRHPGTPIGGWSGAIGDLNAPSEDNWTYDFNVNKNIGLTDAEMTAYRQQLGDNFRVTFHKQPGGLEAGAENIANLPKGYYERIQIGMSESDKRRFIHNKFGAVRDGNPVYSQYADDRHCIEDMPADPNLPVHIGLDGGNTPAALFGQKTTAGQIRVVDECVVFEPGKDRVLQSLGAKEFGQICGKYWNENFAGMRLAEINWADPSAWYGGSDANAEDKAWIVKFVAGFNETAIGAKLKMKPAPVKGNRVGPRLEAVRDVLKASIDSQPAYVISSKCKVLREGFNRGYVITRVEYSTGGGRWKDEPVKNDFSHDHDANQYLVIGLTKFDGWEDARDSELSRARAAKRRGRVDFGQGHFAHQGAAGGR
jgi:hypothetical protein